MSAPKFSNHFVPATRLYLHSDGNDQCFDALLRPIPTRNLSATEVMIGGHITPNLVPHQIAQRRLQFRFPFPTQQQHRRNMKFQIRGENLSCDPLVGISVFSTSMVEEQKWRLDMCTASSLNKERGRQYLCPCLFGCWGTVVSIVEVNRKQEWRIDRIHLLTTWGRKLLNRNVYVTNQQPLGNLHQTVLLKSTDDCTNTKQDVRLFEVV